jgi:hypothetical protein
MKMTFRTAAALGVMLLGSLSLGVAAAHAGGCCGGGGASYRGGYSGGHTFVRTAYSGSGSCCSGMSMAGMQMPATQAPAASMQGMNMSGNAYPQAPVAAAPAAAGARYTCAMHPNVQSTAPGSCPICHMALTRK